MSEEYVIEAENLSKRFDTRWNRGGARLLGHITGREPPDEHVFTVFSGVSFKVRKGESVGILGVNGAGKSTLLQVVAGVMVPTSGRVSVKGRVSALLELGAGFNPEFSGRENIFLNASILGFSNAEIERLLPSILAFAAVEDQFIDRPVKTYSSGMYVRLAFSVAIHVSPDVLIVDEALAVGDQFFQKKCYAFLQNQMAGVTKLFVTHDAGALRLLADRALVIDRHGLIFDGDIEEAIEIYRNEHP
ncbi:MAG: ABC transporter ATP-binding protein [Hyphomicrobiales bacterium]